MSSLLPQHVQDVSLTLNPSEETKPSLKLSVKLAKWLKNILSDTNSRNLFAFLLINLSFAFVELFYGMWTNSLGLISDSFHMFFDCTALLAGLVATIVTRWPPNEKFSYGYSRAETIAGFVNSLFLLFIAFFIFAEAIERAFEPPEVKHDRLLLVSIAGFFVNLIGIFVFHHGGHGHSHSHSHGHSHGSSHDHSHGHSHNHSYGHSHGQSHDHSYAHNHDHTHDHTYGHSFDQAHHHHDHTHHHHDHHDHSHSHTGHSHGGSDAQIMQGIFLHILADTLGSVGVIISSILIHHFGWMLADPICSMFIAALITMSVFPLMKESLGVLMQRTPIELDFTLGHHLQKIIELESVAQVLDCHVWSLCTGVYIANLRVEVFPGSDTKKLHTVIKTILTQARIQQSYVELTLAD